MMNEQQWQDLQHRAAALIEAHNKDCSPLIKEMVEEIKELQAENDRLRKALSSARKQNGGHSHMSTKLKDALYE